jgi:hypothetical protein
MRREVVLMLRAARRWTRTRRGRLAVAILFAALVLLLMLAFSLAKP